MTQGNAGRLAGVVIAALIAFGGCGGAPPAETATADEAVEKPVEDVRPIVHWKIFYSSEVETLEEDGVTVGISATATTISAVNVPDDVAEEIEGLLPQIATEDKTYRLSTEITGSGMSMEILSVDYEDSSYELRFEQGPQNEIPPEQVERLYELVARKPLPSKLEQ
jgi:hypothetical protein